MRCEAARSEIVASSNYVSVISIRESRFQQLPEAVIEELRQNIPAHNAKMLCVSLLPKVCVWRVACV